MLGFGQSQRCGGGLGEIGQTLGIGPDHQVLHVGLGPGGYLNDLGSQGTVVTNQDYVAGSFNDVVADFQGDGRVILEEIVIIG